MSEFEDSMQEHSHATTGQPKITYSTDWTEDVITRDFYPTRFEFFLKDILTALLSRTAPKDEERCIVRAFEFTKMVEHALDSKED